MALIDSVRVMGSGLNKDIRDAITEATLNGSITEVTQLDMTLVDKGWVLLASGLMRLGMTVQVGDLQLEIANLSVGEESGSVENVQVKCRPVVVRRLKDRRGARVMKNASPSDFVIAECRAIGANYVVQPSPRRSQVARDVPKPGEQEVTNPPSSWTTFKRLSEELGFVLYEAAGTIYFGKPSWLVSAGSMPTYAVNYKIPGNTQSLVTPSCERSKDSPAQTVTLATIVKSVSDARTGKKLLLKGVPTFDGEYIINSFDVDLLNPANECSIQATTPINDKPQPPQSGGKTVNTRLGTQIIIDFLYWVQKQIGNNYVAGTEVNQASTDPGVWDGSELVEWGAYQVGVFMPNHPNDQIEYCKHHGLEISVATAIKTRGAILWRSNYVGISLGDGRVIEQVKGKVGIIKGGAEKRYTRAGKIPGILY